MLTWLYIIYYIGNYIYNVHVQAHVNEYNIIYYTLCCLTAQSVLDIFYKKYLRMRSAHLSSERLTNPIFFQIRLKLFRC